MKPRWEILDVWVWSAKAGRDPDVARWVWDRQQAFPKSSYPGVEFRTFQRRVRAGGGAIAVTVGVVRRPKAVA